ncbi:unnamed protein product [Durusdinium trenchii]|uniref:SEC7 domain-containing protein n=1 Tax=Durusdinium trenchii TaxID=1381693 RepID=A0ABP0JVT6_9DINO
MQLTRQPQLRQVRQLQKRREHLEQQALSLAQQEQKMAEASSGSTMPAQGYLNVSRPEDRVRPMACIRGRDLQHWNDTLVYVKCAFFEKATERLEAKVAAKEKARGTSAKSSSTLQPTAKKTSARAVGTSSMTGTSKTTATKSRSRPLVKEETPDEWLVCKEEEQEMAAFEAFIGDTEMETGPLDPLVQTHTQHCSLCRLGMAILYIHTPTQRLYWKCDRDNCSIRWANLDATSEMAVGVLLCPHCQTHQMLHLDAVDSKTGNCDSISAYDSKGYAYAIRTFETISGGVFTEFFSGDMTRYEELNRRLEKHQDYDANFEKHILKKGGKFKMLEEDEDEVIIVPQDHAMAMTDVDEVIETDSKGGARTAVPKGFPYVHVDFSLGGGFVHVVDNVVDFPREFVQHVMAGMYRDACKDLKDRFSKDFDWTKAKPPQNHAWLNADPQKLGDYLSEEYPTAQTLRLEFLNSLPLLGTGVTTALEAISHDIRLPTDWLKVDRLLRGIAHFWWKQHEEELNDHREEGNQRAFHESEGELTGLELQRALLGTDGLHRLMFSTLMLHRWLSNDREMTLNEWVQLNMGIEGCGNDIPLHVQMGIYNAVSSRQLALQVASKANQLKPSEPTLHSAAFVRFHGRPQTDGDLAHWPQASPHVLAAEGGVLAAGRMSPQPHGADRPHKRPPLTTFAQPFDAGGSRLEEEMTWLRLHQWLLFLAPTDESAPFAFVSLKKAALLRADVRVLQIVLARRVEGEWPTTMVDDDWLEPAAQTRMMRSQ